MSRIVIRRQGASLLCGQPGSQVNWERGKSGTRNCVYQHAVLSLIKSIEKRWIETQQENKKPPDALTSMSFPHITGYLFVLQPLMFLYYCWRARCWLRCCILLSHLWSWLLHESRQRGKKEQLIGICWAWLTSNPSHLILYVFAQVLELDGHLRIEHAVIRLEMGQNHHCEIGFWI